MSRMHWLAIIVMSVAVGLTSTGCKKTGKKGADGRNMDVIGGVRPQDVGMDELGDVRFQEGMPIDVDVSPVYFEYDGSHVQASERMKAEAAFDELKRQSGSRLVIEGHCDERGSPGYNLTLGEKRALAVRSYLIGLGADPSQIQTKSMGEESPAAFGHDEASYQLNRRAEFLLYR